VREEAIVSPGTKEAHAVMPIGSSHRAGKKKGRSLDKGQPLEAGEKRVYGGGEGTDYIPKNKESSPRV